MPLIREWSITAHCLAAIWKIEEPESFFLERTGLNVPINNEKRRLEHLTGRLLLKHLKDDFPILNISPDQHDKPRIDDDRYHFSISHSWPYVAVAIDPSESTGIDIETWRENIHKIQHKFLSPSEQALFQNDTHLLTTAWCAKEAAYKWRGRRGVEFIAHLPIVLFEKTGQNYDINILSKSQDTDSTIELKSIVENDFVCVFIHNIKDPQPSAPLLRSDG